eukprot:scaffold9062_cov90-Isochrysis_galbana.AAC.1
MLRRPTPRPGPGPSGLPPTVRGGGRPRGGRGSGGRLSAPSSCPDGLPGGKGGVSLVAPGSIAARGRPPSPTLPTVADSS